MKKFTCPACSKWNFLNLWQKNDISKTTQWVDHIVIFINLIMFRKQYTMIPYPFIIIYSFTAPGSKKHLYSKTEINEEDLHVQHLGCHSQWEDLILLLGERIHLRHSRKPLENVWKDLIPSLSALVLGGAVWKVLKQQLSASNTCDAFSKLLTLKRQAENGCSTLASSTYPSPPLQHLGSTWVPFIFSAYYNVDCLDWGEKGTEITTPSLTPPHPYQPPDIAPVDHVHRPAPTQLTNDQYNLLGSTRSSLGHVQMAQIPASGSVGWLLMGDAVRGLTGGQPNRINRSRDWAIYIEQHQASYIDQHYVGHSHIQPMLYGPSQAVSNQVAGVPILWFRVARSFRWELCACVPLNSLPTEEPG